MEREDGKTEVDSVSRYFYVGQNNLEGYLSVFSKYLKAPVLDLGSGPGRYACYLAENGFYTVGIDTSYGCLSTCLSLAVRNLDLTMMSINELGFADHSFRTVMAMGNNIGAIGDIYNLERLLRELNRICQSDAFFLVTSFDVLQIPDREYRRYLDQNKRSGKYIGTVRMRMHFDGYYGDWFDWVSVRPGDLASAGLRTRWEVQEISHDRLRPHRYAAVLKKK
jgi:SAM-dependent methyltransferase